MRRDVAGSPHSNTADAAFESMSGSDTLSFCSASTATAIFGLGDFCDALDASGPNSPDKRSPCDDDVIPELFPTVSMKRMSTRVASSFASTDERPTSVS